MTTPAIEFIRMMAVTGGENTPNPFPVSQDMYESIKEYVEGENLATYVGNPEDILDTVEGLEHVKLDIQG